MSVALVLMWVVFFSSFFASLYRRREELIVTPYGDRCHVCKYLLEGLPETGICPECGERYGEPIVTYRTVFKPIESRRPMVNLAFVGVFIASVTMIALHLAARHFQVEMYVASGYTLAVAETATRMRGNDFPEFIWPNWPLVFVALTPILSCITSPQAGRKWVIGCVLLAHACSSVVLGAAILTL